MNYIIAPFNIRVNIHSINAMIINHTRQIHQLSKWMRFLFVYKTDKLISRFRNGHSFFDSFLVDGLNFSLFYGSCEVCLQKQWETEKDTKKNTYRHTHMHIALKNKSCIIVTFFYGKRNNGDFTTWRVNYIACWEFLWLFGETFIWTWNGMQNIRKTTAPSNLEYTEKP